MPVIPMHQHSACPAIATSPHASSNLTHNPPLNIKVI